MMDVEPDTRGKRSKVGSQRSNKQHKSIDQSAHSLLTHLVFFVAANASGTKSTVFEAVWITSEAMDSMSPHCPTPKKSDLLAKCVTAVTVWLCGCDALC